MSDITTIARPYAKAVFEHALAKNNLDQWSEYLMTLAQMILTPEAEEFINNPASTIAQHIELLQAVINPKTDEQSVNNFISLLAGNKRLMLLPEITVIYEAYKAEQEKMLSVDVISFSELTKTQEQALIESLSQRLQRQVSLNISIDPSLIGGALIRAGDLVIDGSIRNKLNKLSAVLTA